MAFVYWVHLPEHTDVFTTGYVGFTSKSVEERFEKHLIDAKSPSRKQYKFQHAINKYGNRLVITTLVEGSDEYCLDIEYKLRPEKEIGWNLNIGGSAPPSHKGKKRSASALEKASKTMKAHHANMSPEDKSKLSENAKIRAAHLKGTKKSEEFKNNLSKINSGSGHPMFGIAKSEYTKSKIAESLKNKNMTAWRGTTSNKVLWLAACELYDLYISGDIYLKKSPFTVSSTKTIRDKIISGWNPNTDQEYLFWKTKETENVTQTTPSP